MRLKYALVLFIELLAIFLICTNAATPTKPLTKRTIISMLLVNSVTNQPVPVSIAKKFASNNNYIYINTVGSLEGYFMFEVPETTQLLNISEVRTCVLDSHLNVKVAWHAQQIPQVRFKAPIGTGTGFSKRADPAQFRDPAYKDQWHLLNSGTHFPKGHDINVVPVWQQNITGKGVTVAVLDDGVDIEHPDISPNYRADCSYNFLHNNNDPRPNNKANHGTRCAGEIAAVSNSICGVGVAFDAKIAAGLLLDGNFRDSSTLDAIEASALTKHIDKIDIFSNSWGPSDNGDSIEGPGPLASLALQKGVQSGRNNKGSIYIFASGNGGMHNDNCNMDGYANSIYTIAIGGIDGFDRKTDFSEICSAQLAVTYAGTLTASEGLVTTDNRKVGQACTDEFAGTSSAAPNAAGIVALALQVRPDLSWRDVQNLIVQSATKFESDEQDGAWEPNAAGLYFHPYFGFGKLDAQKVVETARTFQNVASPQISVSKSLQVNVRLEEDERMVFYLSFLANDLQYLDTIEHAQVSVWTTGVQRTLLSINITSPSGTESVLMTQRPKDTGYDLSGWSMDTVKSWGESPKGNWKITVRLAKGATRNETESILKSLQVTLYGSCSAKTAMIDGNGQLKCKFVIEEESRIRRLLIASIAGGVMSIIALAGVIAFIWKNVRNNPKTNILSKIRQPLMLNTSLASGIGDIDPSTGSAASNQDSSNYDIESAVSPRLSKKAWNFFRKTGRPSYAGYAALELQNIDSSVGSPSSDLSTDSPSPTKGLKISPNLLPANLAKGRTAFSVSSPLTPSISGSENFFQQQQALLQQQQKSARYSTFASPTKPNSVKPSNLSKLSIGNNSSNADYPVRNDVSFADSPEYEPSPSKMKAYNFTNEQKPQSILAATANAFKRTIGISEERSSSRDKLLDAKEPESPS